MMLTRSLRLAYARGLIVQPKLATTQVFPTAIRQFSNKSEEDVSDGAASPEETPREPEPVKAAPDMSASSAGIQFDPVPKHLFTPFSVGNIKQVESAPDHKAPSSEDTIEGRYAGVLFTFASKEGQLYNVYEDIKYLQELYLNCETFRLFTENQGVGKKEIDQFNKVLQETAPFSAVTVKFLEVLAENKRLTYIRHIADRYAKFYQEFNKEEKVTIISAKELNDSQKADVLSALKANPQNQGKEFTVEYEIDETILGGLQMYTESEFMDMSLQSRLARLNNDIGKLSV